jgi:hypothetical protein
MASTVAYRDRVGSEKVGFGVPVDSVKSRGSRYEYEPLDATAPDNFRLLLLEPGSWNEPLKGSLFVARESDGIDYAALSYVWGETIRQELILIDGKQLTIGVNLSMFLHYLRHPDQTLTLWTDAVCIDQENLNERGHQVRLMGNIFRSASHVYAWLGDDSHEITTLTSFFAFRERPKTTIAMRKAKSISRSTHEQQARLVFIDLCRRSYWTRTWIVQEILLARSVIICMGRMRILWKDFSPILKHCALQWPTLIAWNIPREMNLIQNLIQMTETPVEGRYSPLEVLLQRYSKQLCLDVRDRIYALLSLAQECEGVIPNYAINRLDLFFQLKDRVVEHRVLAASLDLPNDEIRYRAETLNIPTRDDPQGNTYITSSRVCAAKKDSELRVDIRPSSGPPADRAWARLPNGYENWARVTEPYLSYLKGNGWYFEKDEIVQVGFKKNHFDIERMTEGQFWSARKQNSGAGLVPSKIIELLDISYTSL